MYSRYIACLPLLLTGVKVGVKLENIDCQRPNTYKHLTKDLGTWLMAGHHIAFVPIKLTPRKPSGDQFSRVLITVQIEQQPGFYTGKLVTVLFPLMLIS